MPAPPQHRPTPPPPPSIRRRARPIDTKARAPSHLLPHNTPGPCSPPQGGPDYANALTLPDALRPSRLASFWAQRRAREFPATLTSRTDTAAQGQRRALTFSFLAAACVGLALALFSCLTRRQRASEQRWRPPRKASPEAPAALRRCAASARAQRRGARALDFLLLCQREGPGAKRGRVRVSAPLQKRS